MASQTQSHNSGSNDGTAILIPGIKEDGTHFPIEKMEAHIKGIHHQAVSIFVFCEDALLIQKRAETKYHCGGQWANTCCTHPHFGENPAVTAQRRLIEELGFTVALREKRIVEYSADVGNGLWERERVHMFQANIDKDDIDIAPNPDEVAETDWMTSDKIQKAMQENPEEFTPWFRIYLERFPNLVF